MAKSKTHKVTCTRCGEQFTVTEETFCIRRNAGPWIETKGYQAVCPKCGILVEEHYDSDDD